MTEGIVGIAGACGICGGALLLSAWIIWIWSWDVKNYKPQMERPSNFATENHIQAVTKKNECLYCGRPYPTSYQETCIGCGNQMPPW